MLESRYLTTVSESRDYPASGEVSSGTHVRRAVALVGLASTEVGEAVGLTTPTPGTQLLLEVATCLGRLDTVVKYLDSNKLCGWLVAWGLFGCMLSRFFTVWLPFTLL